MKKYFALLSALLFVVFVYGQQHQIVMRKIDQKIEHIRPIPKKQITSRNVQTASESSEPERDKVVVTIVDLGTTANAFAGVPNLSRLWTDPGLNTVIHLHNMGGVLDPSGSGNDLGYDISKDGGLTWGNMIEIYNSGPHATRYPQACVYNPEGNTDPDNAYVSYFATFTDVAYTWDYIHGVGSIGDTSYHTQSAIPSNDEFYHGGELHGFDITGEGKMFILDEIIDLSVGYNAYQDSLIIIKGNWDNELEDFTYTRHKLEAQVTEELTLPVDYKIAFGLDGQTGYIVMLGDNGEAEQIEGFKNLYPIYWKTTDAGENWDGPNIVQLDGPDGVSTLVENQLTDQQIIDLFGDNPPERDEISYTTAYDCEIAVDKGGRLHIAVVIGPTGSDSYSIITAPDYIKAYDLFQYNENEPFCGVIMGSLRTFRGDFGDLTCDNRIQITTNPEHDRLFISWLDTDLAEESDNTRPNIWCRGFDPFSVNRFLTRNYAGEAAPTNVTKFSDAMW